jgi:thioredoxin reductase (NADPH)
MAAIKVYGAPWCPDCKRSKKFLAEHRVMYDWIDIDQDAEGLRYVEELQDGGRSIPTIVFEDGGILVEPSNDELARRLGLSLEATSSFYDLAIIGGGPAGLTAAIYAAREGMEAIVIEKSGLGGQAGLTERIDNYPGFPDGIGGGELMDRFEQQARRYGVELLAAVGVERIEREGEDDLCIHLAGGQVVISHAAIIATGSAYRRLGIPGEDDLIGSGIHFCATCDGPFYKGAAELLVIGSGNSAMEESLHLVQFAGRVRIAVRGDSFKGSPLVRDKLLSHPQVDVHFNTVVTELQGGKKLSGVRAENRKTGELYEWSPAGAFVFIGLDPNTAFLDGTIDLDNWGFILADHFQTSMPGVFAAGDVRAGSTKQLGSAAGDGIAALLAVRQYLQEHHHMVTG